MAEYVLLATGGYANVSFNKELQIVKKTQPKYVDFDSDRTLLYSTTVDLAAHESLSCVPGLPSLQEYTASMNDTIDLIMPYYGCPLNQYLMTVPTHRREDFCIKVMCQIVATCIQLHENGLQHTDLKPSNIVINENEDVTIIDLNIMSNRVCDGNKIFWTESIGTWNYAAPEIIIASTPCDTSIVWTIGMLIAVVAERFPISKSRYGPIDKMDSRTHWEEVYYSLKQINNQHLPITFCNPRRMSKALEYICTRCLHWDPDDRPQLMELRSMLYVYYSSSSLPPPLHIHIVEWTCIPHNMDPIDRRNAIWSLYDACMLSKKASLFVRTVSWLDRMYLVKIPKFTLCALFMLAWLLQGEYVVDQTKICSKLLDHFDVDYTLNEVMEEAWHVGEQLQWRLFEKTTDVYLFEYGKRDFLPHLCEILINQTEPYTMASLATCI